MQAGIPVAQVLALQLLNGLDDLRGDQVGFLRNAREFFQGIQDDRFGKLFLERRRKQNG